MIIDTEIMQKVDLASYNNDWYNPGGSALKRTLWYFINVLFFINPLNPVSAIKVHLLRLFNAKIGKGVVIKSGVNIKYPWHLVIGNHVWIGENVWIDGLVKVTIDDNSTLSQGCMLLTGSHDYKQSAFNLVLGEIHLKAGSWIGAKAVVCPNVTCGTHSVLAAGSVATKNLEPYTIYQGNPAEAKRERLLK